MKIRVGRREEEKIVILLIVLFINTIVLSANLSREYEVAKIIGDVVELSIFFCMVFYGIAKIRDKQSFIMFSCLSALALVLSFSCNDGKKWILAIAGVYALRNINPQMAISAIMRAIVVGLAINYCLILVGVRHVYNNSLHYTHSFLATRYDLGLGHPNDLGNYFFMLYILYLLCISKKVRTREWVICILVAVATWIVPNSRLFTLIIIVEGIFVYYTDRLNPVVTQRLFIALFLCAILLNIYCVYGTIIFFSSSPILIAIDRFFLYKIRDAHLFYKTYGFKLLGQNIDWLRVWGRFGIHTFSDNQYGKFLVNYGLLFYLIFFLIFYYCFLKAIAYKKNRVASVFFIYSLMACFGNCLDGFGCSVPIILFAWCNKKSARYLL